MSIKIPIPAALKPLAHCAVYKKGEVRFELRCPCGGTAFYVYKSKSKTTQEELQLQREFKAFYERHPWRTIHISEAKEDGEHYAFVKNIFGMKVDRVKFPTVRDDYLIRAACADCGTEYVVFDSRTQGYDAVAEGGNDGREMIRQRFPKIDGTYWLHVILRNDLSLEEFQEEFGETVDGEMYANAFSWIRITATPSEGGKKRTILDVETG